MSKIRSPNAFDCKLYSEICGRVNVMIRQTEKKQMVNDWVRYWSVTSYVLDL